MLKCKMCDYSFSSLHELKKHKYFAHQGGEMLSCTKCDFKAWYHTCLKNHEQSHNKKTIKCDKCDYLGAKNHQKRHKDPTLLCDKCDYKTYDGGNFSEHKKVTHVTVILTCEYCPDYSTNQREH